MYESRGASGYVQKKGRRTTDRETEAQALMWKWVLLRSKLLPGTPGLQFYLGDEAGALASPHLDREQQPCAGKFAVAKPVQAHARQAGRSLLGRGQRRFQESPRASRCLMSLPRTTECLRRPQTMATGWRKTVVPPYQDTQVWDGCSDFSITLFTVGLFGAHTLVPALRCALGTPLTPLIAHLGRLQVLSSAPFT